MKNLSKNGEHLSLNKTQIPKTDEIVPQAVTLESIVTFTLLEHGTNESETYTFKLVDRPKSSDNELSLDSPIGKNIYNTRIGDTVTYTLMSNTFTATILNVKIPS